MKLRNSGLYSFLHRITDRACSDALMCATPFSSEGFLFLNQIRNINQVSSIGTFI